MDGLPRSETKGVGRPDGDTQEARGYQAGAAGLVHRPGVDGRDRDAGAAVPGPVQEADEDGQTTYWGEHVTDDEYQDA
jgi:hypothetical protein